jgi:hypothetical protein
MQYIIGRSSRCNICLNAMENGSISALHAMIEYDHQGNHWKITDLGSKSGTFVIKQVQGYRRNLVGGEFERLDDTDEVWLGGSRRGRKLEIKCLIWRMRQLHNSVRAIRMIPESEDPDNLYLHSQARDSQKKNQHLSWLPADCSRLIEAEICETGKQEPLASLHLPANSLELPVTESENHQSSQLLAVTTLESLSTDAIRNEVPSSNHDREEELYKLEAVQNLVDQELQKITNNQIVTGFGGTPPTVAPVARGSLESQSEVTVFELEQISTVQKPTWNDTSNDSGNVGEVTSPISVVHLSALKSQSEATEFELVEQASVTQRPTWNDSEYVEEATSPPAVADLTGAALMSEIIELDLVEPTSAIQRPTWDDSGYEEFSDATDGTLR